MNESENVSPWFIGAAVAGIIAAFAFVGDGDYQEAKEREARMAKPLIPISTNPRGDFGPNFSPCITDEECEEIEMAWEAAHAAAE